MQANSVSMSMGAMATQVNDTLLQVRTRQAEQSMQSEQAVISRRSEELLARQSQKSQAAIEANRTVPAPNESIPSVVTVNADGQRVGSRINTTA